ncbi:DUF3703 domain-containing protein [Marivirga sp. S37H4]|uniref:DUF3703 domain-containing protein n=1 Tax=Marivirga aurantiaca TaxID=2802615 RepID=A0A935C8F5_9BACT|nr:DUF3703 domain-containing protein [Marivirga aurantiaca]MBK6264927.1 DUF3703 domain-containing protein [Marivirga aurantiaca]
MKLNRVMPNYLKAHFQNELKISEEAWVNGNLLKSWHHLERAHILGQAYPVPHTYVHWLMLVFGFRIKSFSEIVGQLPRLLVGGVKSFVGTIPVGNTGGANVPPLKPMTIPADLAEMMKKP